MTFVFVCCPKCNEVIHLVRLGPADLNQGQPDSKIILCESCQYVFRTKGNTWREEHGFLR